MTSEARFNVKGCAEVLDDVYAGAVPSQSRVHLELRESARGRSLSVRMTIEETTLLIGELHRAIQLLDPNNEYLGVTRG